MVKETTYLQLMQTARQQLPSAFEARQLFFHVCGLHEYDLPHKGYEQVPPEQAEKLLALIGRRKQGEPLQYLLGEWEFFGLPFLVGEGVLIPRPETELLVERALELVRERAAPRILDLCSGSGAVAVALAHHRPDAEITAVEVSPVAFGYLQKNIDLNNVKVEALLGDASSYQPTRPLDLIVSNPPYIPSAELPELQPEVRREPALALDGGGDGLDFYRMIVLRYTKTLRCGGALAMELGVGQAWAVEELLFQAGYSGTTVFTDLAGIGRVIAGRRNIRG